MKKTVISCATSGEYIQVQPSAMPASFEQAWAAQVRDRLRHELAGFGVVEEINLDQNGIFHLDVRPCTAELAQQTLGTLLTALQSIGLHDPNASVEYCELLPGRGQN